MQFRPLPLYGVLEICPSRLGDSRGYFAETFRLESFSKSAGIHPFVQENESLSARAGTVRGLHFQTAPFVQGKLVRCVAGSIFDIAVDLRHDSPRFGDWIGVTLSAEQGNQLWIPPGFAHGFCTLEPDSLVSYKVTAYYSPEHDSGLAWNDPAIGIDWPDVADAETLSQKDRGQPALADLPPYFSMEA